MRRPLTYAVWTLALVALVAPGGQAAEWGDLVGRIVFDGAAPTPANLNINKDLECCKVKHVDESLLVDSSGGLANVVLYCRDRNVAVHPDYDATATTEVVLDNTTCRFEPHVAVLRLTQTLVIRNSDICGHNTNLQPLGDAGINPLIAANSEVRHKFNRAQNIPVPASCNIHPWMKSYVLPRDNPYVTVSAADGTFRIENLPAGPVEMQAWHETAGYVDTKAWPKGRFKVTIKAGTNDLGTIKLPASLFKK